MPLPPPPLLSPTLPPPATPPPMLPPPLPPPDLSAPAPPPFLQGLTDWRPSERWHFALIAGLVALLLLCCCAACARCWCRPTAKNEEERARGWYPSSRDPRVSWRPDPYERGVAAWAEHAPSSRASVSTRKYRSAGETSSPRRSSYGAAADRTMVVAARPPPPPPPRALPFVAPPPPRVRTLPPPAFSGSAAGCGHYSRTVTWTEYTDEHSGHRYYVSERGETTWDRPVGAIIHRGDDAFC